MSEETLSFPLFFFLDVVSCSSETNNQISNPRCFSALFAKRFQIANRFEITQDETINVDVALKRRKKGIRKKVVLSVLWRILCLLQLVGLSDLVNIFKDPGRTTTDTQRVQSSPVQFSEKADHSMRRVSPSALIPGLIFVSHICPQVKYRSSSPFQSFVL